MSTRTAWQAFDWFLVCQAAECNGEREKCFVWCERRVSRAKAVSDSLFKVTAPLSSEHVFRGNFALKRLLIKFKYFSIWKTVFGTFELSRGTLVDRHCSKVMKCFYEFIIFLVSSDTLQSGFSVVSTARCMAIKLEQCKISTCLTWRRKIVTAQFFIH